MFFFCEIMIVMTKLYIDPPSGWKYGFPKVYNKETDGNVIEWLIAEGYPQKEIDACGDYFFTRQWEVDDENEK